MRALAKNRNYTLLWVGEMLSEVGSQMTTIAMPLLVLALTGPRRRRAWSGLRAHSPTRSSRCPPGSSPIGSTAAR